MAAVKMRALYFSNKAKIKSIAETIGYQYDIKVDKIPPAYPCENEKLLFVCLTLTKEMPDILIRFLRGLTKARAQNVAFVIDGNPEKAEKVMGIVREAGVGVCDNVFYYSCGILPFGSVSAEVKNRLKAWADEIQKSITG